MNFDAIKAAPTRTLYRAFERLRRTSGPWAPTGCPETRALVLTEMAAELSRRGWRDVQCLYAPRHAARDEAWRRYDAFRTLR